MAHSHHHHHHHIDPKTGDGRMALAVGVNILLTVAQIVGGILSGSLALIADALHNLSDALSLFIAFFARKVARRPADDIMTFGYGRAEVVAALINYTSLILVGLWLAFEAIMRFLDPQPVDGWLVVGLASLALVIDLVTAWLTFRMAKDSVNIRAAFLHNVADALGSVAVIVAGIAILVFGWLWIDPAITLLIAAYILWMALGEMGSVIRILMLGTPEHLSPQDVTATIMAVEGVDDLHHLKLWSAQEHETALTAHIVIAHSAWGNVAWIRQNIRTTLHDVHGIEMVTLELETAPEVCP
ncbi:cation diffusion facilitator family transporter [Marivivens sp. JLT3646]|uniref:cation diffusion facilitator family transporter n=1 Tax=Marivivens sp. JLT3646 TaxID=1920883 RepID=UPI0007FCE249|nr:cation diffusion facilitator family transporter [Marivivens sp. JLT3646]APO87817.1 cation transporter [Marivivens sp. JLT3646]OBR38551.1 cation diffusion facilitator family transporter [Donghicola sp. JL3646]